MRKDQILPNRRKRVQILKIREKNNANRRVGKIEKSQHFRKEYSEEYELEGFAYNF